MFLTSQSNNPFYSVHSHFPSPPVSIKTDVSLDFNVLALFGNILALFGILNQDSDIYINSQVLYNIVIVLKENLIMYQIAICDDEPLFAAHLKDRTVKFFNNENIPVSITVFTDSQLLLSSDQHYDLFFIDIRMPEIDGLTLAGKIRNSMDNAGSVTSIIFVSSMSDMVFRSFLYTPLRFIRKEMLDEELNEALIAFLRLHQEKAPEYRIEITVKGSSEYLSVNQILYIELQRHYLNIVCTDKTYRIRSSLSAYEQPLKTHGFIRIHQGCLINLRSVQAMGADYVILSNNTCLNIARSCRSTAKTAYMEWERKHTHVLTL